jgi:hypothetical protein
MSTVFYESLDLDVLILPLWLFEKDISLLRVSMKLLLLVGLFECGSTVLALYLGGFPIDSVFSLVYIECMVSFLLVRVSSLQIFLANLKKVTLAVLCWALLMDWIVEDRSVDLYFVRFLMNYLVSRMSEFLSSSSWMARNGVITLEL